MTLAAKAAAGHALVRRVPARAPLPVRPRRVEDHQHASRILTLAPRNRAVLPRWGLHSPVRSQPIAPGAYAGTIGWTSREHYLGVVVPITLQLHPGVLRRHEIAVDTFRRFLAAKTLYAQEQRTGRYVIVRPDTIAGLVGLSERHVQKCTRAARELGLEIVLETGRMLSEVETYAARRRGSPQRGLSTTTAFVVPGAIRLSVYSATPTRGRRSTRSTLESRTFETRSARQNRAPLRSARPRERKRGTTGPGEPAWDLAVALTQQVIFLRRCPPGRISAQLRRFTDPGTTSGLQWTAERLTRAMDQVNIRLGYTAPVQAKAAPWALLSWYLGQVDPYADHPAAAASCR